LYLYEHYIIHFRVHQKSPVVNVETFEPQQKVGYYGNSSSENVLKLHRYTSTVKQKWNENAEDKIRYQHMVYKPESDLK